MMLTFYENGPFLNNSFKIESVSEETFNFCLLQIQTISRQVRKSNKLFILVIPPPVYHKDQKGFFDADDFNNLIDNVDFFSLMTYDYSTPQRPGKALLPSIRIPLNHEVEPSL